MMTFPTLVNLTHTLLAAKSKSSAISVDIVQQVLKDAGIAEAMEHGGTIEKERRLIVREIWFSGNKWHSEHDAPEPFAYRRQLGTGLNGWVGGNSAGKSTVLKLIVWALTGISPNLKADVRTWIDEVAVEVEIVGEGIYTIYYTPRSVKPKVAGAIYPCDLKTTLNNKSDELAMN